ncbi:MAG: ATP-binding protein [Snowella sp.]|nr:ATP-binding protein [Snowella sp.]
MESLIVDGVLESLKVISDYISVVSNQAQLETKKAYKLRLAVDELTTNIIIYGYQNTRQQGVIKLQSELDETALKVIIEDTAPPFNPKENLPPATQVLDKPLEERPIGGLGIYLAIEGVDDFSYERVDDHNRTVLVINR